MSQPLWELLRSEFALDVLCSCSCSTPLPHTRLCIHNGFVYAGVSYQSGKTDESGSAALSKHVFSSLVCSRALHDALPLGVHVRSRYFRPLSLQLVLPVNKCAIIHVTDCLRLPFTARRIDVSRPAQSEVSRGLEGRGGGGAVLPILLCLHLPPPLPQRSHTSPFTRLEAAKNVRVMGGCLTL